MITHHSNLGLMEIGMRVRIASSSLMYRKVNSTSSLYTLSPVKTQVYILLINFLCLLDITFVQILRHHAGTDCQSVVERHVEIRSIVCNAPLYLDHAHTRSRNRLPDMAQRRYRLTGWHIPHNDPNYSRAR